MKRKHVVILLIVSALAVTVVYFFGAATEKSVTLQLLDGDTEMPILNHRIYICDDSMKLHYIGEYPYPRFCDGEHRKIVEEVDTDSSGIIQLSLRKLNIKPPHNIVFDIGNSDDRRGIVKIERSDTITHRYSPSHIRVVNQERSGHVFSNQIYNLDTGEVREIFTSGSPEKIYTFSNIELKIFKKD